MSYRKLTVDDKEYQYTIGKKFTKIKTPDSRKALIVPNEDLSYTIAIWNGELYDDEGKTFIPSDEFMVTPGSIANYLRTGQKPMVPKCNRKDCGCTGMLVVNPFVAEIYKKTHYMNACARCHTDSAMDI